MKNDNGTAAETQVARRVHSELAIADDKMELLKRTICKGATDDEFALFAGVCKRTGLDPFARQIFAVKRWDAREGRELMAVQVSIDGFRLIAERSGKYAGQVGPQWCGPDGVWVDVWTRTDAMPTAARVGALRSDFKEPAWGVARFDAYAQKTKDGKLTRMWASMGDTMIAKCAEAQALRKAFPQDLSGLYTGDEMAQAENDPAPAPTVQAPKELPAPAEKLSPTNPKVRLSDAIAKFSGFAKNTPEFKDACKKLIEVAGGGKIKAPMSDEDAEKVLAFVDKCVAEGFTFEKAYANEVKP